MTSPEPPDQPFTLSAERHQEGVLVRIAGPLDLRTRPQLESFGREVLSPRPQRIDLDVGRVEFIDSAGISALISIRSAATKSGFGFRLMNPTPAVRQTIERVGLASLLLRDT